MSLWTPEGEVPIEPNQSGGAADAGAGAQGGPIPGFPDLDDMSPEERERAEQAIAEMAELQRQIASAPASQVIANHAIGLYELAAIHLAQPEPKFDEAQLAIDALTGLLGAAGDRLVQEGPTLRDALAQVQMAYVQRKGAADQDA